MLAIGLNSGLFAAAICLWRFGGFLGFLISQLALAVFYFQMFALLHEAGHGTAGRSRATNEILGHCVSVFCFLPFYPWKYIHTEHHTWTGNIERDPTLGLIRRFRAEHVFLNRLVNLLWLLWLPFAGLGQHAVFWAYPFRILADGTEAKKRKRRCLFSLAVCVCGVPFWLWLLASWVPISQIFVSIFFYLILVELINFPHHLDTELFGFEDQDRRLPVWEQGETTRSCYYPFPTSEVCFLNFNFHVEHHIFPNAPWWYLRKLRLRLKQHLEAYRECHALSWSVQNRRRPLVDVAVPESVRQTESSGVDRTSDEASRKC